MRLLFKVCVVAALAAFVAAPAPAQPPRGIGSFFQMSVSRLVQNKDVQKEIKLSEDQAAKIEEATKKFQEEHKDDYDKLRSQDTPREQRSELMRKLGEGQTKVVSEVLKPEQVKRLKQIQLQQQARFAGLGVFASEDVQKELKLSDEQKDQIKTLSEDLRKDFEELRRNAGDDRAKLREVFQKRQEMSKDALEKVMKTLSEEQRKAWKEMQGEPFELRLEFRRPGSGAAQPERSGGDRNSPSKKVDF